MNMPQHRSKAPRWISKPLAPIGLGLSKLGSFSHAQPKASAALIGGALDLGVNLFDTADIYGQGQSEQVLGLALRHRREQAIICTKVGYRLSKRLKWAAKIKPILRPVIRSFIGSSSRAGSALSEMRQSAISQEFGKAYLSGAVDDSLRRLQTDYVDLLLLHSPPPNALLDEAWDTLLGLKQAGKILAIGVSARTLEDAMLFAVSPHSDVLQVPFTQSGDQFSALCALATQNNKGLIVRELFTGIRPMDAHSRSQALRRPFQYSNVDAVIVGTGNLDHLRENAAALSESAN